MPNTDELFTIFPNHFILSMPKDLVSGDFYWAVIERKITQPDKILNLLRQEIILALKQNDSSKNKDGMDMSLIFFNPENNLFTKFPVPITRYG